MRTQIIKDDVARAAEIIKNGGLVAVPTETVYGLACNGLDEAAVDRLYEVKGRPRVKPLSLMVPDEAAIGRYCTAVPFQARQLAQEFWPGPLTIVLRDKPFIIPEITRAHENSVALRCPDHPLTLALLRECELPLAAPSANPSGAPSPKTAAEVLEYFDGRIDAVIDGGDCGLGRESTIIFMADRPFRVLRHGALNIKDIGDALTKNLTVIGITGGTGTGKTTALEVLRDMGAMTLDCDRIYHELTEKSATMRAEIVSRFGPVYRDGKLDRKALGEVVFSNPRALSALNAITHRHVTAEVERRLRQHALSGGTLVGIDAVALIEGKLAARCDAVFGILADRERRIARIMQREGITRQYALKRVNAQKPDEFYRKNCTRILENNGTKEEFAALCRAAFKEEIHNAN